ncbi:MAG: alcohol dehydrogenase catalytic domain-containing protein [bacterium]|nr:alcohol dehydrogenase catalytic domain-containing protein [bacterium]
MESRACRSDLSVANGTVPFETPAVLGHEGAGTVERIGPRVNHLATGDRVVLATRRNCGTCAHRDRLGPRCVAARSLPAPLIRVEERDLPRDEDIEVCRASLPPLHRHDSIPQTSSSWPVHRHDSGGNGQ